MLSAIRGAEASIELEQFILGSDEIGLRFIDALKEGASRGVAVRILCDEVGSFSLAHSAVLPSLVESGAQIKFFNSIVPWSPNSEAFWYFRDHRKLLIIDERMGFAGGVCIRGDMRDWRESTVSIEGAVVSDMRGSFEAMWSKSYHKLKYYFGRRSRSGKKERGDDFQYLSNSPLPGKRYIYKELVRAISEAKHYIYLTTPYFLPDSRILRNLKEAAERGVEVRLLVPQATNHKVLDIGMGSFFRDLLEHSIKVFLYNAGMIHSKTAVIDGRWSTIGSMNLDNLSLRYNFEANIVATDKRFAFELERQFLEDLKLSTELTLAVWQSRSILRKFLEILVWPIRKFL